MMICRATHHLRECGETTKTSLSTDAIAEMSSSKAVRVDATKNQTNSQITGNSQKIELAHILLLGRPMGKINQDICSLLKNCFISEKIGKLQCTHI